MLVTDSVIFWLQGWKIISKDISAKSKAVNSKRHATRDVLLFILVINIEEYFHNVLSDTFRNYTTNILEL